MEGKYKTALTDLEEITHKKAEVEDQLQETETLSTTEKQELREKLAELERKLVTVVEVKDELELKLEQVCDPEKCDFLGLVRAAKVCLLVSIRS